RGDGFSPAAAALPRREAEAPGGRALRHGLGGRGGPPGRGRRTAGGSLSGMTSPVCRPGTQGREEKATCVVPFVPVDFRSEPAVGKEIEGEGNVDDAAGLVHAILDHQRRKHPDMFLDSQLDEVLKGSPKSRGIHCSRVWMSRGYGYSGAE